VGSYLLRRIVLYVPTLFLVSVIIFVILRAIPGDAVLAQLENSSTVSEEAIEQQREELGLNAPIWQQYVTWMGELVRGDLGTSFVGRLDIRSELAGRLSVTVELAFLAFVFSVLVGVPLGALSAITRGTPLDYSGRLLAVLWLAVPSFWLATLVLVLPAVWLGWSPSVVITRFQDGPVQNLIDIGIPAMIMGLHTAAVGMRMTRSQLLEVLQQDYIRTAYAKGLKRRIVVGRHALKNALIPVLTIWGTQIGALIGGSVIMETIFGIPGIGSWTADSIRLRDYPVIQTLVLFFAFATLSINLLVDIAYTWLDPRIKAR
jgi:peptide/nickel transport system permease protein